jgi:thymidylate synthase
MKQYQELLHYILENGEEKDDRTSIGTYSIFGYNLRFDLNNGFPAVTTKKLAWKSVVGELLWFIEGSGDERRLAEITHGSRDGTVTIWTPNALAPYWKHKAQYEGDLGRVYGVQWRDWQKPFYGTTGFGVDQLQILINGIKTDPNSRRHILTAWNPGELDQMALPPCHILCQFYVSKSGKLSCHMYQRSVDVFLGLPFNIASYALFTHMIAQVCGLGVGELIISTGDTHIYKDHIDPVKAQLTREPLSLPKLVLNSDIKSIDDFTMDDIRLEGYEHHGTIKAKMAV